MEQGQGSSQESTQEQKDTGSGKELQLSLLLLGKGLTAPGSAEMELLGRAGWRLGWTRKCPQAPNIFLYRNGLEKLYNLIRVIIVPQKTQA